MVQRVGLALVVLALAVSACSGGTDSDASTVTGAVVAVTGPAVVESFVLKDTSGSNHQFTMDEGTLIGVDELRALVVSQQEVTVSFVRTETNRLVAVSMDTSG